MGSHHCTGAVRRDDPVDYLSPTARSYARETNSIKIQKYDMSEEEQTKRYDVDDEVKTKGKESKEAPEEAKGEIAKEEQVGTINDGPVVVAETAQKAEAEEEQVDHNSFLEEEQKYELQRLETFFTEYGEYMAQSNEDGMRKLFLEDENFSGFTVMMFTAMYSKCTWVTELFTDEFFDRIDLGSTMPLRQLASTIGLQIGDVMLDDVGYTPLHLAVLFGHPDTVEILLERGAQTELKTDAGFTALDFAKWRGEEEILAHVQGHYKPVIEKSLRRDVPQMIVKLTIAMIGEYEGEPFDEEEEENTDSPRHLLLQHD
mmetsp:Transcript_2085/g.2994  ORF Transcript_2085/g.2994 Transcript_2085/m.2994 type:complete len:315 (+) Transcript_2085:44-988(+)